MSPSGENQSAVGNILGNMQPLVLSKQAGSRIFRESDDLLEDHRRPWPKATRRNSPPAAWYIVVMVVLTILAVGTLGLLAKTYLADTERRADEAESQRQSSEQTNRENQDAILRLMNELGDLADGDLTVTATVSENITGAIADSINYTIEELRVLVGRINDAATRVTAATEIARQTSNQLLAAAEKQSQEIQEAGQSALSMARSMNEVSGNATQSAQVARQSLAAAEKGRWPWKIRSGHERNPRADPGNLQAHQAPRRKLPGDRRNRRTDFGHYRTDQRSRP